MSDAPELPKPRYDESGERRELICDEQEWLARPASWGISKLPDEQCARKRNLYDAHFHGWMAGFSTCAECCRLAQALYTEDGLRAPPELRCLSASIRKFRETLQTRYTTAHPTGNCDLAQLIRAIGDHECGLITHTELHYQCLNNFTALLLCEGRKEGSPHSLDLWKAKERELALELVGPNPFRPIAFDPAWRTDTAVAVARGMYDSREFGAMPILADALQDAGCDSEPILLHCRDPHAAHVRGCWVCDLVLGL